MGRVAGISGDELKQFVERIESLEEEKTNLTGDIRDAYLEAKVTGFDPKILRQIIRLRKMDRAEAEEQEALLTLYMQALGMISTNKED